MEKTKQRLAKMCDFRALLDNYANTLPGKSILFRVSKPCGYSRLILLPRIEKLKITHLLETVQFEMGDYTVGKLYYFPKHAANPERTYFPTMSSGYNYLQQYLAPFAVQALPLAYTLEECQFAVYQLWVDVNCQCDFTCACGLDEATLYPLPSPPPLFLPPLLIPESDSSSSWSMEIEQAEDEPTREELLSLLYDAPTPPSPSPTNLPFPNANLVEVDTLSAESDAQEEEKTETEKTKHNK